MREIPDVFEVFRNMFTSHGGEGDCEVWDSDKSRFVRINGSTVLSCPKNIYGFILRHHYDESASPSPREFADALGALVRGEAIFDFVRPNV